MKATVITHKECWASTLSPSGYVTTGGFPFQIQAICELFDETKLINLLRGPPAPTGGEPLRGENLGVYPLKEPPGTDWKRKLSHFWWLPLHLGTLWTEIKKADVVHAIVPGDFGTIGILVGLLQRKRIFVRYCGTWGQPATAMDHFLFWLLEKIAGGRNVVLATGGGERAPSGKNPEINWIFSTTLSEKELREIPSKRPWSKGQHLKLVTVGRLSPGKNTEATIRALPLISKEYSDLSLDIIGDGPCRKPLQALSDELGLSNVVKFHGNLPHFGVMRILAASDLFLFPTRVKEGFPKAVLEAMACALPVIATRISVIPYIIGNHSGITLPEPNPKFVSQAVLRLVSNEELFRQLSARARETSRMYTLEAWQNAIREKLEESWGNLKSA